ncbi:hypothetical protein HID58_054161, partial [Brassica napus]
VSSPHKSDFGGERKEIFTCRTQILSRALGSFVLLSDDPSQDPNPGSSLAMAKERYGMGADISIWARRDLRRDIRVSLWDMKSGEANRKRYKFSIKYQLWKLFGIFGHVFSPALMVQNEIFEEMRSHGLIGSHGLDSAVWVTFLEASSLFGLIKPVTESRARYGKDSEGGSKISARIETRIVDELYLDLASIHPAESGSANFMLVVHLDNRNISGNRVYLDMVFGLGWTGRSHLLSIEELLGKYHFGADYYLSISILKAIKRNDNYDKFWYCGRRLRRQHLY